MRLTPVISAATIGLALAGPATAAPLSWTDWQTAGTNSATGQITSGSTTITVTYSGPYRFVQTGSETNDMGPPGIFTSPLVPNAPPPREIIALDEGGTKTITFSQPVVNPLLAMVSWNANSVDFGTPIQILSSGCGAFGCGSPTLNSAGTGFSTPGTFNEFHGTSRLPGTFSSITFTDQNEGWHGFTVGITALAQNDPDPQPVPEPGTLALIGLGLAGLAGRARPKSQAAGHLPDVTQAAAPSPLPARRSLRRGR